MTSASSWLGGLMLAFHLRDSFEERAKRVLRSRLIDGESGEVRGFGLVETVMEKQTDRQRKGG